MNTTDAISTILPVILTALATPVAAILSGLLWKAWTWVDAKATEQDKKNMEDQIHSALSVGINQALPILLAKGASNPEARAEVLKVAVDYFQQRFPDRSKTITTAAGGKTTSIIDTNHAVTETIEGRVASSLMTTFNKPVAVAAPVAAAPKLPPKPIDNTIDNTG